MILFTGHGSIAGEFINQFDAKIESFRKKSLQEKKSLIKKSKVIVHNAANLNEHELYKNVEDNFVFTKQIIDLCEQIKPDVFFVYISSMSFLNLKGRYKNIEDMTNYAYSKYLGESYCIKSSLTNKTSVRFSTIFYHNPLKDGLSKLISDSYRTRIINLINNGTLKRDFIPLEVCIKYLNLIIEQRYTKQIVNICSGQETKLKEIAEFLNQNISNSYIKNTQIHSNSIVCSQFSSEDIDNLGRIDFSLKDNILEYLEKLKYEDPCI